MAIAFPITSVGTPRSETRAATWTAVGAGITMVATIPFALILMRPVQSVLFVRGTEHNGDWGHAFLLIMALVAPAAYTMFFGTAGELLKNRVSKRVHKTTMRVAALGMVPYIFMTTLAVYWQSGPQQSLLITACLTIPIAMVATIWASAQNH